MRGIIIEYFEEGTYEMSQVKIVSTGVVATSETDYRETDIRIIRTLCEDGDNLLITRHDDAEGKIAYLVPTEAIRRILAEERQGEI